MIGVVSLEKPILFSTDMVRAILDGRKTETRRPIKPQPIMYDFGLGGIVPAFIPPVIIKGYEAIGVDRVIENPSYLRFPYQPRDILYVRETWQIYGNINNPREGYFYKASPELSPSETIKWQHEKGIIKWKPSIHMPKEAARIFLRVKDVMVKRLQDMDVASCVREGVDFGCAWTVNAKPAFIKLWDSVYENRGYSWDKNPWVWVIKFERIEVKP